MDRPCPALDMKDSLKWGCREASHRLLCDGLVTLVNGLVEWVGRMGLGPHCLPSKRRLNGFAISTFTNVEY